MDAPHARTARMHHTHAPHAHTFILCAQRVLVCGIYCFILQDVTDPPPALFLSNPQAYLHQVHSASGIVLFWFLRVAGIPALQWQKDGRDGAGEMCGVLHALMLHACRCWGNKPNCVLTSLLALMSYFCTHSKISAVVLAFSSVSLLGHVGMHIDRLLEYINLLQQKRMSTFQGFDNNLHHTELLQPMIHVDHAYQEARKGHTPTETPITNSMIFQTRAVQDLCVRLCGTDLTVRDPLNRFWYTGNAVRLEGGDYRWRKPWEWLRRVAAGLSAGCGRARAETAEAYVRNVFANHMFPM